MRGRTPSTWVAGALVTVAAAAMIAVVALPTAGQVPTPAPATPTDADRSTTPVPGVSRSTDGRAVLHRRVPSPSGSGSATGGARQDPPAFVYDPVSGGTLPHELHRDGQALSRPDEAPRAAPGEQVYSPDGLSVTTPPEPDATTDADAPAPAGAEDAAAAGADDAAAAGADDAATPGAVDGAGAADSAATPGFALAPEVDPSLPPSEDGGAVDPAANPLDGGDPTAPMPGPTVDDPRAGLGDTAAPDRDTEREGTLDYRTVFDPSVVPFKRNRALNRVARDYELFLSRGRYEVLAPIGNRVDDGREAFWGSVVIEGRAGERVPLPSVSPESRILSYEAVPPVALKFEKDAGDNFYATPAESGRFRVVFVMDAPTRYFGRAIPTGMRVTDVPPGLTPAPPREVVEEARGVAAALGLTASMPYDVLLNGLVRHFRDFVPGEPPPARASVYKDVALGKIGICRHRSHGFVVTALGLGIPARYVFNEAHVFVEVYVPGRDSGWLRIDLGGGAERLRVHGGEDKTLHEPRGRDPFDQPTPYAEAAAGGRAAGATEVDGLPAAGAAPQVLPSDEVGTAAERSRAVRELIAASSVPRAAAAPGARPTRTTLNLTESIVFRGDGLTAAGRVVDATGSPVTVGEVRVLLLAGAERQAVRLLASTTVGDGGVWEAEVRIPEEQPAGAYEIVAEFAGTSTLAPSVSD